MSSVQLQQLKRRLEDLVENVFELGLRNFGGVKGDESYILLLSRATGGAEALFQRLARGWDRLDSEFRNKICIEWEGYCHERLEDLKRPCNTCNGHSLQGILGPKICTPCSYRIKFNAGDFERYTKDFLARLEPDVYFPSLASRIPVDEQVRKSEYADQEYERIRAEHEKTCKDLEKAKGDLSDADQEHGKTRQELEKVQEDLNIARQELTKTEQDLEMAHQELTKTEQDLKMAHQELAETEQELENASEIFQRFTTAFHAAEIWEYAAEGYEELHRMELCKIDRLKPNADGELLGNLKVKSLDFRHKLVGALIKKNDYARAEPIAEEVWKQRKSLLSANSRDLQASHRQYCLILRLNKAYETAQQLYMLEWFSPGLQGSEEEYQKWRLENGYELGCVTAEMEYYREAENWFRAVLATAIKGLPNSLEDAVKSAIQIISLIRRQGEDQDVDPKFAGDLELIWKSRMAGEEDKDTLACGHELGIHLHRQKRYAEAESVLSVIWEQRKKESALQDAISSADCLAEAHECQEKFPAAEAVRTWICANMAAPHLDEPDTFRSRYKLACVQVELEHYAAAEATLGAPWAALRAAADEALTDKLETGYLYGFVLAERADWPAAADVLTAAVADAGSEAADSLWTRELRHRAADLLHQKVGPMAMPVPAAAEGEQKRDEDAPADAKGDDEAAAAAAQQPEEQQQQQQQQQQQRPAPWPATRPPFPLWFDDAASEMTGRTWATARTRNTTKSARHGRNEALKLFFRGGKRWG